jgi:hypothetical protein
MDRLGSRDSPIRSPLVSVFSVDERERVRDRVLELAASDERVIAGAVVGSLAEDDGDRWSDLDLTFSVVDGVSLVDVLSDWTRSLVDDFRAIHLFDLPSGASIYRVFLLPGCLQLDLSFNRPLRSAPTARSSNCSSAKPLKRRRTSRLTHGNSSATQFTTRCGLASASSVGATGRLNTGLAGSETTP